MPYIPGVSEKLKKIGNKFEIRTAFKSHATLRSVLTKTKPQNEQQESKNCVYNVINDKLVKQAGHYRQEALGMGKHRNPN